MTVTAPQTDVSNLDEEVCDENESTLSRDEIFHVLQNQRRRRVLRYLEGVDGTVRMSDVAEQVAAWEHDTTVEALTSDQRQRVYIALYQAHLPKLDEEGIIEYNQSRGYVERTELADQLTRYLVDAQLESDGATDDDVTDDDVTDGEESTPWTRYYLGASGLGTVLIGLALAGTPLVGGLGVATVGLCVDALFLALSLVNIYETRRPREDVSA